MPRLTDSVQRPTTLLTVKKTKATANIYNVNAERGELIMMTDDDGLLTGDLRVATANTNPLADQTVPFYPIGSIIYYAGTNQPSGWLFCNGSVYSKSLYSELFNYLGNEYSANATHFRVPDYTNSKTNLMQGGLFVRNLNPGFPTGNPNLPDYIENKYDYNQKGDYNVAPIAINREFGTIQYESYPYHNHDLITGNTGFTNEVHSHKYFGAEGSTNGVALGNTNKYAGELSQLMARSGIGTTDSGGDPSARIIPPGSPLSPTGQEYEIGSHVHTGWIGHGQSISSNLHNTFHSTSNNFNNVGETQPKNYSVYFCIKY